jgi:hypothetical protein
MMLLPFTMENMHFSFGTGFQMRSYTGEAISLLENVFSHHTLMRRLSVGQLDHKRTRE